DIEIHNRIGVEASTIGNHEFDLGTNAFSDVINDAAFPYLSSNLDFSADSGISSRYQETVGVGGLEEASTLAKKIVPSAVATKGGEKIGLVGVTTQILEAISSTGNVEVKGFAGDGLEANDMVLLAAQLQPVIDDLRAQGVNKIILMAHLQQIAFEQALAPLLEGVDIILAAGSNTRLGDGDDEAVAFPGHAADFANTYPIVTAGKDGKTTLIVNTDNEYTYLGRLVVEFDENGEIITDALADMTDINGAYASTTENVAAAWGDTDGDLSDTAFAEGTKGEQVADITEAVDAVIQAKDGQVFGYTNVYLEGERNLVRNQETNLGNITADANLEALSDALGEAAPTSFIVSLKNGGGIRAQIGSVDVATGEKNPPLANDDAGKAEGGISQLDIENSLRFNNGLMAFDTTAEGLKAILEHGVASLGGQGRYPQIGGMRFSYDKDLPAGSRVQNIALIDENDELVAVIVENGVVNPDAPATITMVTLNFLANGGDGYPMKANGENFRFLLNDGTLSAPVDESLNFTAAGVVPANILGEQQAMADYVSERYATPETAFD
ncbi:5'-nucleotidase C-terminal domain-containing protein, partial [Rhabdaerophilum sp. SD176]|uniref:bifunctional metallophosphatase/5'-nucleotidase n=1 Tax=Rhabdaerophilum sp. SD176 TaxID=2983548 RepID=UPI0024DFB120